ncbi:fungal-specific transcription factor domain-containing protein [Rhexocercosporidium sp. MPI-PUGE-AT-0058]|nr:fungal-specific transcription factor domain-containing protein [Rhexocercosporidium sp. MPI-PUGE-AT-0058]
MPSPNTARLLRDETTNGPQMADESVNEPLAKRRRVFLQTMGHQLREIGMLRETSRPSETGPGSFSGSPGAAPISQSVADSPSGHAQVQIQTPESDAVPGEEYRLPTGASMSAAKDLWLSGSEVSVSPGAILNGSESFSYDDLRAWTDSYFDHWHLAYPFLDALSILEFFDRIVQDGITETETYFPQQMVILRAIMSISLADRRQMECTMQPVPSRLVFSSINDAMKSAQYFLVEESSIVSLQAVASVQLFLLSMLRYNAASRLGGSAVRMAFHLGMHRCPVQCLTLAASEAQLRQRIFWSVFCMDRYICIRLGVPLAIRDADVSVCFPGSERHGKGDIQGNDHDSRLDLLRYLARLAEIRGSIMELRNKFVAHREANIDDAVTIDADLTKWWNEVDEYLESNSISSFPICQQHQVTLIVLRHESSIALNKHILATSKKSSAYDAALQNCISAARSIISTLHKALATTGSLENQRAPNVSAKLGMFWPSFTWAVWMSAFILIYAANEDQISQDVSIRLAGRALDVMNHLNLRGTIWPGACAVAIRDLRAQLVIRRNRSKHTRTNHGHTSKGTQDGEIVPNRPRLFNQQSSDDHSAQNSTGISNRPHNPPFVHGEGHQFLDNHQAPFSSQTITGNTSSENTQAGPGSSYGYGKIAGGLPLSSQSFSTRPSSMPLQMPAGFDPTGANGYAFRVGAQLESGIQIQNYEDLEFFYGFDAPFWVEGDSRNS